MPLVRIELIEGMGEHRVAAIGNAVHEALVATLGVPQRDRFQVITEHARGRFIYDRSYLDIQRGDHPVFVQVFLSGRTTEQKQAFYAAVAKGLSEKAHVRPEDVAIVLTHNAREDWSFGNGEAQYVTLPKESWK
jgi:phenylpyruvate tautomerase PptA (4-oxalocrotonate tautomerase family)